MAGKTSKKSAEVEKKAAAKRGVAKPILFTGGNPQIAKADGDVPVQAYIAAMPGWKRNVGRRLDALIVRAVPGVRKGGQMELAAVRSRGPRLVPRHPLLHEVRQSGFLPRTTGRRLHEHWAVIACFVLDVCAHDAAKPGPI
jgi:hypothetical protein